MLEVRQLSYRKAGRNILSNVSLGAGSGEFVVLLGPNGAGKSTLLRHVAGVLPAPEGTVFVDGGDRSLLEPRAAARLIAYVPQAREPDIPFTCDEMVAQARYPHLSTWGTMSVEDRSIVHESMENVGVADLATRVFRTLSGGEQQKVLIAAALAQRAGVLLLDEPTTFLDPAFQDEIFMLLDRLRRERLLALVVVTHDVNRALVAADKIVALRDGEIVAAGTPGEISGAALEEVYGARFPTAPHPDVGTPMIVPRIGGHHGHSADDPERGGVQ